MFSLPRCLTVSEVNSYIKNIFDDDQLLSNLWVKGEITNFKQAASGHLYYSLKDGNASIKCVMFYSAAQKLLFKPENGMKVMLHGYISIYAKDGQYQLYTQEIHAMGLGDLHIAFEQLKKRLDEEGLFAKNHKRPIPVLPRKIGIVTSIAGAALHDIITVARRRNPNVELIVAPTSVQGIEAPPQIIRALTDLNGLEGLDLIIVARGGGSLEELWAFNTEEVGRAIFNSRLPVISAIGHETDYTIADFIADLRAPTPSAAAEMAVPSRQELQEKLHKYSIKLTHYIKAIIETNKLKTGYIAKRKVLINPIINLDQYKQTLDHNSYRIQSRMNALFAKYQAEIQKSAKQLNALSPLAILQRGFVLCRDKTGKIISKAAQVVLGEEIKVTLQDGYLDCKVIARGD